MGRPTVTARNFWNRVDQSAGWKGCWPWTGSLSKGRGRVDVNGVEGAYCSRVAYFFEYPGKITLDARDGKHVLHSCDNPLCCNPRHLRIGSHTENMRDKVKRGRSNIWAAGSLATPRAKLSGDDVRAIRKAIADRRAGKGGPTNDQLAAQYGVSRPTIKSVMARRTYADVPDGP